MPSWLKPARCLSMGQRQRIESAIRASRNGEDGIVFDDFCAYVDDQNLGLIWDWQLHLFCLGGGVLKLFHLWL